MQNPFVFHVYIARRQGQLQQINQINKEADKLSLRYGNDSNAIMLFPGDS